MKFNVLDIFITSRCNYNCLHCAVRDYRFADKVLKIDIADSQNIISFLKSYPIKEIRFTGGEPTLELDLINSIINETLKIKPNIQVTLLTNGWFCSDAHKCKQTLQKVTKIDNILVSYDKYHEDFIKVDSFLILKEFCVKHSISMKIAICIESPMDLIEMKKIEDTVGVKCAYQKTLPIKNALYNNCFYKYNHFDESILKCNCPGIQSLIYYPSLGFTQCCGTLLFNNNSTMIKYICSSDICNYTISKFYNLLNGNNFGQLAKLAGIQPYEYKPNHSIPCELCYFIFCKLLKKGCFCEK